jgi:hypothetical protein
MCAPPSLFAMLYMVPISPILLLLLLLLLPLPLPRAGLRAHAPFGF